MSPTSSTASLNRFAYEARARELRSVAVAQLFRSLASWLSGAVHPPTGSSTLRPAR
ncbi:MAG: RSP_7527 family protein [Pseudomonadota bacterium]